MKTALLPLFVSVFRRPLQDKIVTPPSGRGQVIPVFFLFFLFFFCRCQLPQTSARSKQYLPVILVRLALFRQNFHESWCTKLPAI